jgi:LysM repeat protein
MVKGYLAGEFGTKLSSYLGESRDKTQAGIDAAIPGILAAFHNTASKADGARLLASTLDGADDSLLSNVGSWFGRNTDFGTGTLGSILGVVGLSELTSGIGRTSGLSGKSVATLLGVVTPILLGVLKKVKLARALDSLGLSNLLSSQRDNIAGATPEGMRTGEFFSYREPIREVRNETYRTPQPASRRTTETYSAAPEEPRRSSRGWILPLALLAGLLGLLWLWSSRPAVRAGRDDSRIAQETARRNELTRTGRIASFEALKAKYNSVIETARNNGVRISSLTHENGKMVIRGTAPSAEAVNKVREEIRRLNPQMDDVVLDINVDSSAAKTVDDIVSRAKPSAPSTDESSVSLSQTYIVKRVDTLGKISKEFYGTPSDYMRIFNENRSQLKNQDTLHVGQKLEIPME